ncbi:MAG TPA: helix-turn-helix domain-containing protein [Bacteroidia bacterium]|nr:helix-turn-helix domain-containing protein [Bacteroidia bacterium]HNU34841.1 helix-turn-helix domain-containing protein [Bacteroidia bacterium]
MKKKNIQHRSTCPISTALDIFGDKWSLLIVRDLMFNQKKTYGEFLTSEEKIATNILADRLMLLESGGIISKEEHPESKAKVLYKLTAKGVDLIPVMVEIILWSEKHHEVHPFATQFAKMVKKDRAGMLKQIKAGLNREQF